MGKRSAAEIDDAGRERKDKRVKIVAHDNTGSTVAQIQSAQQLHQLLAFRQDAVGQLRSGMHDPHPSDAIVLFSCWRTGIRSFKAFLESICYAQHGADVSAEKSILRDYLEQQKLRDEQVFLHDLFQTWSFAAQAGNDWLVSSVASVLALLLKTISGVLEFTSAGLFLCKTILQLSQLKQVARCLSAPKHKEHLVSPCLRLLTEVVSFDGGALAKQLYSKRDFTFDTKILSRNLGLRKDASVDDRRRPSVRSNAVRYLLANLKYQNDAVRIDILKNSNIIRVLFEHIGEDSPESIRDIIGSFKTHVVLDKDIPRSTKSYVINDRNLTNIASLYRYEQATVDVVADKPPVNIVAHDFLKMVCTTPNLGALVQSSGWYPPGTDKADHEPGESTSAIDLGLESIEWYGSFRIRVPVRNTTLASFAHSLRPYNNTMENELLVLIFKAAPELVADYFFKKTNFPFDPKVTATWIGFSSFLFSVVQLPVPKDFGRKGAPANLPPPVSIVIESILCRPLTQKALTRCMNQNSDLITFFAVRILVTAFEKLRSVLGAFRNLGKENPRLWDQAADSLICEFCQRCPKMKDVVTAFRRVSAAQTLQREALTRLLSLYYSTIPQVALDEKFDVSLSLTHCMTRVKEELGGNDEQELKRMELGHLLQVAECSPDMKWWQKPESFQHSTFTTLLKLTSRTQGTDLGRRSARILGGIVEDAGILTTQTTPPGISALLSSLHSEKWEATTAVYDFLDECLGRFVRKPIKYQDDLDSYEKDCTLSTADYSPSVSPLFMVLVEQWLYVSRPEGESKPDVATWLSRYLRASKSIGENEVVLGKVQAALSSTADNICEKILHSSLNSEIKILDALPAGAEEQESVNSEPAMQTSKLTSSESVAAKPPPEQLSYPELTKWRHKDLQEVFENGHASQLIMCLCASETAIRLQAVSNLQELMKQLEAATYEEWEQAYLLLAELTETSQGLIEVGPLPAVTSCFAARAAVIVADPGHYLYPKVNRFLNKGPVWSVPRLLHQWVDTIILQAPDEDDARWKEVEWLLDLLYDALRRSEDMDLYRSCNVFERILTLYGSPYLPQRLKQKVLLVVLRATWVQGSMTLVTRSGILSWVKGHLSFKDENEETLRAILQRLGDSVDAEKVEKWSALPKHVLFAGVAECTLDR